MYISLDFPFFRQRRKTVGGIWSETGINREREGERGRERRNETNGWKKKRPVKYNNMK